MDKGKEGRILTCSVFSFMGHDGVLVVEVAPVFPWGRGFLRGENPGSRGGGGGGLPTGRLQLGHRCTDGEGHGALQVGV